MNHILRVVIQSISSFFFLFIISKLLGKKQVAQLEFADYVVGISIGSIAAQMAVEPEIPYFHFLIAIAIYGFFDLSLTSFGRKSRLLKSIFKGRPLIIINKGEIDYKQLKRSKLDVNELVAMCRVKGYFDLQEVEYCLFESSGAFSIMPKDKNKQVTKGDMKIKESPNDLPLDLVVDGRINKQNLKKSGKDTNFVLKKANLKNKKHLKSILLMSFFKNKNKVEVYHKK